MRVELVGGLGVGKTTIAGAFKNEGFILLTEKIANNPFLPGCYEGKIEYNYPSQLWFVQTKYEELLSMKEGNNYIFDQALLNTRAYIQGLLPIDSEEYKLMNGYLDLIDKHQGYADLYIYLKCTIEEQMNRIQSRGREMEKEIPVIYLETLQRNLDFYIDFYKNKGCKVLEIDVTMKTVNDYKEIVNDILY